MDMRVGILSEEQRRDRGRCRHCSKDDVHTVHAHRRAANQRRFPFSDKVPYSLRNHSLEPTFPIHRATRKIPDHPSRTRARAVSGTVGPWHVHHPMRLGSWMLGPPEEPEVGTDPSSQRVQFQETEAPSAVPHSACGVVWPRVSDLAGRRSRTPTHAPCLP